MSKPIRRIDHVVHAVHDLDGAAETFRKMGFIVGARNRHPWGTENRLIQFRSSFIELITMGPDASLVPEHADRRFSFGAWVRDYLNKREGIAMVCLDSDDARRDAETFAQNGIGDFEPFDFERKGRRPDGSETHVAFSLAFAFDTASPDLSFFVCQQHYPENFWNPEFQRHANGATDLAAVVMATPDPGKHLEFAKEFTGALADIEGEDVVFNLLNDGRFEIRKVDAVSSIAISVGVQDLERQAKALEAAGLDFRREHGMLSIEVHGTVIRFQKIESVGDGDPA